MATVKRNNGDAPKGLPVLPANIKPREKIKIPQYDWKNPRKFVGNQYDAIENPQAQARLKEQAFKDREREAYLKMRERQGYISTPAPKQSTKSKVWDIATNPMSAAKHYASYWSKGMQAPDLPDYYVRGNRNTYDDAADLVNPFFYAESARQIPGNIQRGEYSQAGMNLLNVIPATHAAAPYLKSTGKYLDAAGDFLTRRTALRNAHEINPWRFKAQKGKIYRQVGEPGFNDAIKERKIYDKGQKEFLENYPETNYLDEYNQAINAKGLYLKKPSPAPFFSKDELFFPINRKATGKGFKKTANSDAEYLIEGSVPDEALLPRYMDKYLKPGEKTNTFALRPEFNDLSNFNLYKRHWLKGYKKLDIPPKPLSNKPSITDPIAGVDDLGIYSQVGDKKYYKLGEGFGDIGTAEQQNTKFLNKLSKDEFRDYVSKLSNAEKRKLYGLPAYDIDKSLLNQAKHFFTEMQHSGEDIIHPWYRKANTREFGDEMRGAMKNAGFEPTNLKDVEKFRKVWLREMEDRFFKSQKPIHEGNILDYHLNNVLNQNKEGGEIINKNNNMYYMTGGMYAAGGEADTQEQVVAFIAQSIQQGADPEEVVEKLAEAGIPEEQAVQMVQSVMQQLQQMAGQQQQMKMGGNPGVYSDGYSGTFSGGNYFEMGGVQPSIPTNTGKGRAALLKFINGGGLNYADKELTKMLTGGTDGQSFQQSTGYGFETPVNMPFHTEIPEYLVGGFAANLPVPRRKKAYGGTTDFQKGGEYDLSEAEIQDLINKGFKIQYV